MDLLNNRIQKRLHISLYALLFLTMLLGLSVLLEGCSDTCETKGSYVYYEPQYTPIETIRSSIAVVEPQPLRAVGKIYFKDDYLFVNEPGEGIHIIDDSDQSNPISKKFIRIPGNYDLAIKGDILYADSYMDLVALDISDLNVIKEIDRMKNIFDSYNSLGFYADEANGVVTSWVEKQMNIETADCDVALQPWGGYYTLDGIALRAEASANFNSKAAIAPGNGSGPGLGGSLARMTISADHLYLLNGGGVEVVDISSESQPELGTSLSIGWDIETIFPYKDKLFVGARTGMHILDISSPDNPSLISTYQHIGSCDPVVVEDDFAYVTLRSGNPTCDGFDNQLEIIDIKNPANPVMVETYPMTNPYGLGVDDNLLFVCDGSAGLKMYDITDKHSLDSHLLATHKNINGFDVIPFQNVLMLIGEEGILQYDYSDNQNLKLLSHIAIQHVD
jgi:hypothetical protein